jgi:hypothetical protein
MTDQSDQPQLAGLLRRIVEECPDPARLIELYYWSAENELADVMRQFVGLSAEVRATLHAFLMLVKDEPGSVSVQIASNGDMTLSAPAAAILAGKITGPGSPPPFLH